MKTLVTTTFILLVASISGLPVIAGGEELLKALRPGRMEDARIHLNPVGAQLGFELEITGSDPRVGTLIEEIRASVPGGGHKCPNAGAIRFRMTDGRLIAVGLLPGHEPGDYAIRLYDGRRFVGTRSVNREAFLAALEVLGVPTEDPAFRE